MPTIKTRISINYDCGCIYDMTLVPKPNMPGHNRIEDIEISYLCPEHDYTLPDDEKDGNDDQ